MLRKTKPGETRQGRTKIGSKARRDRQRQELRQTILDAAADLFVEKDIDGFSMRQIAERIGYSATTIYRYFKDKDALLFAVIDEGFVDFGEALAEAASSTTDPKARILALGRAYVSFAIENPDYYRLMFMRRDYLRAPIEGSNEPRHDSFLVLEVAVKEAMDAGVIKPGSARDYCNMLWAVVHGVSSLAIAMPYLDLFPGQPDIDAVLEASFDGLRPR